MKKLFLMLAAFTGLTTLFSCSSDESLSGEAGSKATITVTAQLPTQLGTRAINDGLSATKLSYAVYEQGSTTPLFQGTRAKDFTNREATLELTLAIGKTYDFVFWADAPDAPYTFNAGSQSITVDYTTKPEANNEKRDAFFGQIKAQKITDRSTTLTATLYRPFAQINVATDDSQAALAAGRTVGKSSFTVTGEVYKTLNLLTGDVSDEVTAGVSFTSEAVPGETIQIDGKQYTWLSMDYVLTTADKATTAVTATLDSDTDPIVSLTNVPMRRNYRTNIYGSLLTSATLAKIRIDQNFNEPFYPVRILAVANGNASYTDPATGQKQTFTSIQGAIAAITNNGKNPTPIELQMGTGTYDFTKPNNNINNSGSSVTVVGDASVILDFSGNASGAYDADNYANGTKIEFDGVTLRFGAAGAYNGFGHNTGETYKNCTIEGEMCLFGTAVFDRCSFVQTADYCVRTWGAPTATFTDCTFQTVGRCILVYGGGNGSNGSTINFTNCQFKASQSADDKAAIQIDGSREMLSATGKHVVNITGCMSTGFSSANVSGSDLWNVKTSNKNDGSHADVFVDGTQVFTAK